MSTTTHNPARTLLQFDVTDWTPERVAALVAAAANTPSPDTNQPTSEDLEPSGWDTDGVASALTGLRASKSYAQVKAITAAAYNGGYLSRADTYAIAGYDPNQRSLKGFTRPVNRVVTRLQDDGRIDSEVEDLLQPVYDSSIKGYQRATGFRIPADVAAMVIAIEEA